MKKELAKVSERALIGRINRKLAREPEPMRVQVCRENSRWYANLGRHYIVHCAINTVDSTDIDLEAWGRELGVLGATEALA